MIDMVRLIRIPPYESCNAGHKKFRTSACSHTAYHNRIRRALHLSLRHGRCISEEQRPQQQYGRHGRRNKGINDTNRAYIYQKPVGTNTLSKSATNSECLQLVHTNTAVGIFHVGERKNIKIRAAVVQQVE